MRILDCSTVETTIKSLSDLLKTDEKSINSFINSNKYRIINKDKCWRYDNLYIDDVLSHFNLQLQEIYPDKLFMFHLTTGIGDGSFRQNGVLNLESIIKNDILSAFFAEFGIQINYEVNSPPIIKFKGQEFTDDMLFHRFNKDKCINGFLIKEDAENNSNVRHIRECPEFIWDISNLIKMPELVGKWKKSAKPMKLSLLVNFEDVDYFEPLEYVLKAIEYVLFKNTSYWDPDKNFMVFLQGEVCISPENITEIEEGVFLL
ncbi:hypothetical protein RYX56_06420 [Alkalihalophilus lindianensis]|uniref:Uncharacterized protein n=1 Tax=Alkalihalophilus lindianensis TaxID=1630542 RepID=A0ABU3X7Y7_9BACI|nr:hypothetical protein [Alkalihalophilus lindianensis]MDV2684006.1 hypothetical protein [Alkalihalophilus lindianensis]